MRGGIAVVAFTQAQIVDGAEPLFNAFDIGGLDDAVLIGDDLQPAPRQVQPPPPSARERVAARGTCPWAAP